MRVVGPGGQIQDVPDEQAWAGLQSGDYGLEPGSQVNVKTKTGHVGTVRAEDLATALQEGYVPATQAEWNQAAVEQEYGGAKGMAIAGGAGLARGATLGLSDAAIAGLGGPEAVEALNASRELHGGLSMGAELGGALVPLLFSGGSSGAATGAELAATGAREASLAARALRAGGRALTAPARLQQGLGTIAENAAARGFAGAGEGALARAARGALPDLARGVVEGGIQGVGNSITEQALGDHNLTAEEVIANIGHGALMGGALGGGIGLARHGLSEARQGLGRLLAGRALPPDALDGAATKLTHEQLNTRAMAATATEADALAAARNVDEFNVTAGGSQMQATLDMGGVASPLRDIHNAVHGVGDDVAKSLRIERERQIGLRMGDKEADGLALRGAETFDNTMAAKRVLDDNVLRGANKDAQMARLVDEGRRELALGRADDVLAQINEARATIAADPMSKPVLTKLDEIIKGHNRLLTTAAESQEGAVGKTFAALDNLKHDVGKLASHTTGQHGSTLQNLYNGVLKPALEDEAVWSRAANSQRIINRPLSELIPLEREVRRRFEETYGKRVAADSFDDLLEMNPGKLKSLFKQIGGAESVKEMELLDNFARVQKDLADASEKAYDLTPKQRAAVQTMRDANEAHHAIVKEANHNMGLIRRYAEEEAKAGSPLADAVGAIPGVGPVLKFALTTNPVTVARRTESLLALGSRVKTLLGLKAASDSSRVVVEDVAKRIVSDKPGMLDRVAGAMRGGRGGESGGHGFSATSAAVKLFGSDPGERRKRYTETRDRIIDAANNPARAQSAVSAIAQDAPNVAAALQRSLQAQAQYLAKRLPVEKPASPLQPGLKGLSRASDAQIEHFARHMAAIESPQETLDAIARGTATPEAIQAVKETSPALFAQVQQRVADEIERMTEAGEELPYPARVRVSVLLGIPADNSMRPEFIRTVQTHYTQTRGQQPSAPQPPRPTNAGSKLRTDRLMSAADTIEKGIVT